MDHEHPNTGDAAQGGADSGLEAIRPVLEAQRQTEAEALDRVRRAIERRIRDEGAPPAARGVRPGAWAAIAASALVLMGVGIVAGWNRGEPAVDTPAPRAAAPASDTAPAVIHATINRPGGERATQTFASLAEALEATAAQDVLSIEIQAEAAPTVTASRLSRPMRIAASHGAVRIEPES